MNSILTRTLDEHTRPFNDICVSGIAKPVFENIPEYLDRIFSEAVNSLNKNIDFKYKGWRRVSPEEELLEDNYLKARGKDPDLAKNDVYSICFKFEYQGETINKYVYLPFASRGNIMTISGTPYVISPVITDLVISVDNNKLFIRLFKDKINVQSELKNILINENLENFTSEPQRMIYVKMLSSNTEIMKSSSKTPFALYLLARYGIAETLKKYTKLTYGVDKDFWIVYDPEDKINVDLDKYNVYSSTGFKPKGYDASNVYKKQKVKIVADKKIGDDPVIMNIILSIIYAFDMNPGRMEADMVETILQNNIKNEISGWRFLLGRTILKSKISPSKVHSDVEQHMENLETHLDSINREKLSSIVKVDNYWDLIVYTLETYATSISNSRQYNADVNNIYIDLYYYICYDIIIAFNRTIKHINSRFKKSNALPKYKEVAKLLNNELKQKIIFDLVKSSKCSLALSGVDYSGDNLYIKLTSSLENQNRGDGVRKGGDEKFPMANRILKPIDLVYGTLLYLGKNAPTPTLKMNLWADIDFETGKIIVPEYLKEPVRVLGNILKGVKETPDDFRDYDVEVLEDEDIDFEMDIDTDIDVDMDASDNCDDD